jgi:hypothetical protein
MTRDAMREYQQRRRARLKAEAADQEKYGALYRDMERIGSIPCSGLAMVEAWPRIDYADPGADISAGAWWRKRRLREHERNGDV